MVPKPRTFGANRHWIFKDLANPNNQFFNVLRYGADLKLSIPRIFLPFRTEKIIPSKSMIPSTLLIGIARQTNIGLDKENFTRDSLVQLEPKETIPQDFDLFKRAIRAI
jgi:hypothetical protein